MTAKDYVIIQLTDPKAEATSVLTRTTLSAYALRLHKGVPGYTIPELRKLVLSCEKDEQFAKACCDFVTDADEFMIYVNRIPNLED